MKLLFQASAPNPQQSSKIAKEIAERLQQEANFSVFLEGGLGAGKTFLVREILRTFGISESIGSPTYIFVNEYQNNQKQSFAHFDFYRFKEASDFFKKGFDEIAEDETISCFTEWGERLSPNAKKHFSGKKFVIRVDYGVGVGMRKISFYAV